MKTTCILCPVGCELTVSKNNGEIEVSGNECPRGIVFGKTEFSAPVRMLTTLIKTPQGIASVKLSKPIYKHLVLKAKNELSAMQFKAVKVGDVVLKNICDTDADVIVTHLETNQ